MEAGSMEADKASMQKLATLEAEKRILYEKLDVNEHMDSQSRQLKLLTTPSTIGVHSLALGIYFTTVLYTGILLAVLSLISLQPLLSNKSTNKFSDDYTIFANASVPLAGLEDQKCVRNYDAFNSVTSLSYGAHCSSPDHTNSVYSCPATCEVLVDSSMVNQTFRFDDCSIFPCSDTSDPAAYTLSLSSRTPCCKLELDVSGEGVGDAPVLQYWVFVLMLVVILVWYTFLRRKQNSTAANANLANITPADFTVYLIGLGSGSQHREDRTYLTDNFASQFGNVATAVYTTNAGTYLRAEKELARLLQLEEELQRIKNAPKASGCFGSLTAWLYLRFITFTFLSGASECLEATRAQIQVTKERLGAIKASELAPIGEALITYEKAESTKRLFGNQPKSLLDFLRVRLIDCQWSSTLKFKGRSLYARRAPEPTDLLWENTDSWGWNQLARKLTSLLITVTLLAIGAVLQFQLEDLRSDKREDIVEDYVFRSRDTDQSFTEKALQQARLQGLSMVAATVVVVINTLITLTLKWLNEFERHHTRTDLEVTSIFKLTMAHLINSVVVPLFVMGSASKKRDWYTRGGLAEQACWIQVGNAIVPNILFWAFSYNPQKYLFRNHVQTQPMMNALYNPVDVLLAERYANLMKTVIMALLYMPILPLSLPIALGAVAITYMVDALVMLRNTARPRELEHYVVGSFNKLLITLAPSFLLVASLHYFAEEDAAIPPLIVGMVIWGIFYLLPPRFLGLKEYDAEAATSGAEHSQLADIRASNYPKQPSALDDASGSYGFYAPPEPQLSVDPAVARRV
eukprot:CAMPEP_0118951772 /NCGR_PEP_ID=MMETSP1169-20130426/53694_1 /TAXON_ID=36882 /ORGANISM="Pyramimonas obovata, Strain CCMP722" /LENGTH=802 /DNA_ID=CAMNT_0006898903 /DNA_START=19 /DNA_END=2423 /DNA_ORIENTATION=-